jgi:hypothetical protein
MKVRNLRQRANRDRSYSRRPRPPIHDLLARHIAEAPSTFQAYHIPEPKLIFAGGHEGNNRHPGLPFSPSWGSPGGQTYPGGQT